MTDSATQNEIAQDPHYPPAMSSLEAIRALTRGARGTVKVIRTLGTVGIPGFRLEAEIRPSSGFDLEIEVAGESLPQAAYELLEIVRQVAEEDPA